MHDSPTALLTLKLPDGTQLLANHISAAVLLIERFCPVVPPYADCRAPTSQQKLSLNELVPRTGYFHACFKEVDQGGQKMTPDLHAQLPIPPPPLIDEVFLHDPWIGSKLPRRKALPLLHVHA